MATYVLTGCASGIGAATRLRLEAAGNDVIGVDLRDSEIVADLSDAEQRTRAVNEAIEACNGKLDGLVTAAGVGPPRNAELILAVNWFGTEAFLTGLRDALAASESIAKVVAISSNSTTCSPNTSQALIDACLAHDEAAALEVLGSFDERNAMANMYAASKTAVARYVRRNAATPDWAGAGIRLNAIAPGAVATPLLDGGLDDEYFGAQIRSFPVPTGGFGEPDQIAAWIEFMLSDAADFMAGSVVFVDGGTDAMVRSDAWPVTFEFDMSSLG